MCHLVSWRVIPKTDAELSITQCEEFNDEQEYSGLELARKRAEQLAQSGARDVKVWSLVGQAKVETVVLWKDNNNG